jgi:hypothetical protein
MTIRSPILLYLTIVIIGCVVCDTMVVRLGGMQAPAAGNWITGTMWTPAVAAIVTQFVTRLAAVYLWRTGVPRTEAEVRGDAHAEAAPRVA